MRADILLVEVPKRAPPIVARGKRKGVVAKDANHKVFGDRKPAANTGSEAERLLIASSVLWPGLFESFIIPCRAKA